MESKFLADMQVNNPVVMCQTVYFNCFWTADIKWNADFLQPFLGRCSPKLHYFLLVNFSPTLTTCTSSKLMRFFNNAPWGTSPPSRILAKLPCVACFSTTLISNACTMHCAKRETPENRILLHLAHIYVGTTACSVQMVLSVKLRELVHNFSRYHATLPVTACTLAS